MMYIHPDAPQLFFLHIPFPVLKHHARAELLKVVILVLFADDEHIVCIIDKVSIKILQDDQFIVGRHEVVLAVIKLDTTACHHIAIGIFGGVAVYIVPATHIGPPEGAKLHIYVGSAFDNGIVDRNVWKRLITIIQCRAAA